MTSPVVDGDRVYFIPYAIYESDVWEMRCPIVCLKTDGTELWRADKTFWATEASTPLVVGDTLYVGADNPERVVLVALDKMTGKLRWSVAAESEKDRELGAPASLTYQVVDGDPAGDRGHLRDPGALGRARRNRRDHVALPVPGRHHHRAGQHARGRGIAAVRLRRRREGPQFFRAVSRCEAVDGKIACREVYRSTELQTNMYNTVAVYQDAVFGFGGNQRVGFLHCTNLDRRPPAVEGRQRRLDQGPEPGHRRRADLRPDQERRAGDGRGQPGRLPRTGPRGPGASNWADRSSRPSPTAGCTSGAWNRWSATRSPSSVVGTEPTTLPGRVLAYTLSPGQLLRIAGFPSWSLGTSTRRVPGLWGGMLWSDRRLG